MGFTVWAKAREKFLESDKSVIKNNPKTTSRNASSLNQMELLIKTTGIRAKGETNPAKTQTIKCPKKEGLYMYSLNKVR